MVTMAQRIEELRTQRGLSRPALAQALSFPKNAIEKFETGRATPTQEQQESAQKERAPTLSGRGTLLESFFTSKQFQDQLHAAVLSLLRTPEGEELIAKVVRKELLKQR